MVITPEKRWSERCRVRCVHVTYAAVGGAYEDWEFVPVLVLPTPKRVFIFPTRVFGKSGARTGTVHLKMCSVADCS